MDKSEAKPRNQEKDKPGSTGKAKISHKREKAEKPEKEEKTEKSISAKGTASADENKPKDKDKTKDKDKDKSSSHAKWAVQIFFISVGLSALLSFISNEVLEGADLILAFGVLLFFIVLGIVFDIIGVAVTAADERPFHSMATHRIPGAKEAIGLIRKADKVSSFCNDVVGDICGIVSGTTAAVIVLRLQEAINFQSILISLAITAMASGLTIGGKAVGKTFAIERSTKVLQLVGRFLHLFSRKKR